ncbi:unnamed protein product [Gulo gulo]|uniref:Uncharacterized protein n=1 Tax=Gulo gulo TaxID=48420 RepID=A0A9X9LC42_GULGU|nr:unnamed protein product [Gulo gulo]
MKKQESMICESGDWCRKLIKTGWGLVPSLPMKETWMWRLGR